MPEDRTDPLAAAPGHASGHFAWADLIADLVERRGSLAAVALHLAEQRAFAEDVESVERGLRRLRGRGVKDGGVWGERVLRVFGLPSALADRLRWMGQYHSRFTDLPASIAAELLRPWRRPPVSQSPARIWLLLGEMNLVLRRRGDARALLQTALHLAPRAEPVAQVELALVEAFVVTRSDPARARAAIDRAEAILPAVADPHDHACLFARWIDQVAYGLNRPTTGAPDYRGGLALYERIPADGPLFARCRRENGLGWTKLKLGDRAAAEQHARASVEAAGDAGSLRLRAMALNLLARATRGEASRAAKDRALAIAQRLEDEALAVRFTPPRSAAPADPSSG